MQQIRRYAVVVSLFAMVCVTSSSIAAPRNGGSPPLQTAQNQVQKQRTLRGWIVKILDELESKLSFPPP